MTRPVVLSADDLRVTIPGPAGDIVPVDGVSLELCEGEVLGIVGESGSGKTVTCRSLLSLMPTAKARHTGTVTYPGVADGNVLDLGRRSMRGHWGEFISMIPQNPMTSLNPVHRIGAQIEEAVTAHPAGAALSKKARRDRVIELMTRVGIPVPEKRLRDYPHQFSGGMLQRTLIAIALAGHPRILVADEPTTALDVIIQDQILSLLLDLQRDLGMGLVLVSHDLSVIAQICDRVAVMYAGQIVEQAPTERLLREPRHPYTAALLRSLPGSVGRHEPLTTIGGAPPQLVNLPPSCRFRPRCPHALDACGEWTSELLPAGPGLVRCLRHDELALATVTTPVGATAPDGRDDLIVPMHRRIEATE